MVFYAHGFCSVVLFEDYFDTELGINFHFVEGGQRNFTFFILSNKYSSRTKYFEHLGFLKENKMIKLDGVKLKIN